MKVLVILEFGIPSYRKFLFEFINNLEEVESFLVLHSGTRYSSSDDYMFPTKKLPFLGSTNKLGIQKGVLPYIKDSDVIITSFNLRIISCWYPLFLYSKKKFILWGKGLGGNESSIILGLRKYLISRAELTLVYNENKKDEIVDRLSVDKDKILAVNNTIAVSNAEYIENNSKKYFLYFGRIQERKGLVEALHAYKEYLATHSEEPPKFRIVGDGDFKEILGNEASVLEIQDNIEFFPGVFDDNSIKRHFSQAIAYVSPFNVGLGVINSMAYGIPVITTAKLQVGPEFDYLNEENSFICKDISDLPTAMFKAYKSKSCLGKRIFEYYKENLESTIMLERFKTALLKKKYEN